MFFFSAGFSVLEEGGACAQRFIPQICHWLLIISIHLIFLVDWFSGSL